MKDSRGVGLRRERQADSSGTNPAHPHGQPLCFWNDRLNRNMFRRWERRVNRRGPVF